MNLFKNTKNDNNSKCSFKLECNISENLGRFNLLPFGILAFAYLAIGINCYFRGVLEGFFTLLVPMSIISALLIVVSEILCIDTALTAAFLFLINLGYLYQVVLSNAAINPVDVNSLWKTEVFASILGLIGAVAVILALERFSQSSLMKIVLVVESLIMLITLVKGSSTGGVKAWVYIGGMSIQTTELIRFLTAFSYVLVFTNSAMTDKQKVIMSDIVSAFNFMFLLFVNEIGTLMTLGILLVLLQFIFIEDRKIRVLALLAIAGMFILCVLLVYLLNSMYKAGFVFKLTKLAANIFDKIEKRFLLIKTPEAFDPNAEGYQQDRAMRAILLGGFFGGDADIHVPVRESDYAFPVIIMKFGLIMGFMIIIAFAVILLKSIDAIYSSDSDRDIAIVISCSLTIFLTSMLTIMGSSSFIPISGQPISFISNGGSNALICYMSLLLILYYSQSKFRVGFYRKELLCPIRRHATN
ncbi:MAG: FtsW/RodA/SpoVE family cell cycle protein [Eubacterium sp.]|nr:FtsW/RodA/SpoVE family cell cycle protein [Eubacterium sp.]